MPSRLHETERHAGNKENTVVIAYGILKSEITEIQLKHRYTFLKVQLKLVIYTFHLMYKH